jgi:hypothetical protein
MTSLKHHVLRVAAGLAAGVVLAVSIAAVADASTPENAPDLAAAKSAAHSKEAALLLDKAAGKAAQRSGKSASATAVVVQQDAVPVYALNPAFVSGKSGEVAALWYVATTATKGGSLLTVFTAPDQSTGAWHPVNVATGNLESRMSAAARGARVFTEPQIGAWYALTGDQIRALNPSATQAIGSKPISINTYRQHVTTSYADKQPGSTYAKNGTAGGYDTTTNQAAVPSATGSPVTVWLIAAATIAGALLFYRRRRTDVISR